MDKPGAGLTVGLFATCINDIMFPQTPQAVVSLLERLGCRVSFSEQQTCCGQMFTNTGYFADGLKTVKAYVAAFADCDYVVAPSASCVGAVRHQHSMLVSESASILNQRSQLNPGLAEQVERLAAISLDLTEFLVDVLGITDVGASFRHTVTYHPTCHSVRVAHVGDRPLRLLKAVRGLQIVDLPDSDTCCGFGGTFSVKNSDVSIALATQKANNVHATGAEYLVTVDNACLMNIGGVLRRQGSPVKPIHLAEILNSQEAR